MPGTCEARNHETEQARAALRQKESETVQMAQVRLEQGHGRAQEGEGPGRVRGPRRMRGRAVQVLREQESAIRHREEAAQREAEVRARAMEQAMEEARGVQEEKRKADHQLAAAGQQCDELQQEVHPPLPESGELEAP